MRVAEEIESLKAYIPGKPIEETQREYGLEKVFKLASNENPLGPSPAVLQAISKAALQIHRYPDAGFFRLRERFAHHFEQDSKCISFGNGSNELIDLLIRIYCSPGDKILCSQSSFMAYQICAQAARVSTDFVSIDPKTLQFDPADLMQAWTPAHKLVFIPNPNNPTGSYLGQSQLEKLLHFFGNRPDVILVFDEAYVEYADAKDYVSALRYRSLYENLVVIRSFSKAYGLAGLRLGAVFAAPNHIAYIDKVRNPFNVNSLAQAAALAAIDDTEYIKKVVAQNRRGKEYFYQRLTAAGIRFWPSQANFVLVDCEQVAAPVVEQLLRKGIIVRPVGNYSLPNCIRVSIGTDIENQLVMDELIACLRR